MEPINLCDLEIGMSKPWVGLHSATPPDLKKNLADLLAPAPLKAMMVAVLLKVDREAMGRRAHINDIADA
eukprot:2549426-Pyramimonas_sp.AAC.1